MTKYQRLERVSNLCTLFLIGAHLAHAQIINKIFALGQKLEREGMINK